jgi:hypothetical protein
MGIAIRFSENEKVDFFAKYFYFTLPNINSCYTFIRFLSSCHPYFGTGGLNSDHRTLCLGLRPTLGFTTLVQKTVLLKKWQISKPCANVQRGVIHMQYLEFQVATAIQGPML